MIAVNIVLRVSDTACTILFMTDKVHLSMPGYAEKALALFGHPHPVKPQLRDMVLAVHSNASYLSEAEARSRVGGHFFCSQEADDPIDNGAVLNISKILKAVMSSAAEAELGALYINAREAIPMHQLLTKMGHKQPKQLS